jgi:hypothetical protein
MHFKKVGAWSSTSSMETAVTLGHDVIEVSDDRIHHTV